MLLSHLRTAVLAISLVCAIAAPAAAQQAGIPPALQATITEFEGLRQRLDSVRLKASESPAVKKKGEALQKLVEGEMTKRDPSIAAKLARFEQLRKKFEAAGSDQAAASAMLPELQTLAQTLGQAQNDVMQMPGLKAPMEDFANAMRAEMLKIDPESEKLIARAEALSSELRAALGAPGMGPMGAPPAGR